MTREDTISNISSYYKVCPQKVGRVVKKLNKDWLHWKHINKQKDNISFTKNMGEHLCIDEVALSKGELYTYVTNPTGRAKKGTIVASIKGTRSADIIEGIDQIPLVYCKRVKTVTLDMASNMSKAIRTSFPNAELIIDRFHVVKLVIEALQHERIQLRWKVIDQENIERKKCLEINKTYKPHIYANGDTERQLIARSRHLLFKTQDKWTERQEQRAQILFAQYPRLEKLYHHTISFRNIYTETNIIKAKDRLEQWIMKTIELPEKVFITAAGSISNHLDNILNFFKHMRTNGFAESFNSKIKRFRFNQRGVSDQLFFSYRLFNLFA